MDAAAEVNPRQALGQRIKDARTTRSLSRFAVAREVGCTPETIRNIEDGRTSSSATRLAAICRVVGLELSLEDLAAAEAS
jgi:transcriptional regulator with XRE-family HTH domain